MIKLARNKHYHDEKKIRNFEKRIFSQVEGSISSFNKIIQEYRTLYTKFKKQKLSSATEQKIAKNVHSYAKARLTSLGTARKQETSSSSKQLYTLIKSQWSKQKRRLKKVIKSRTISIIPLPFALNIEPLASQFNKELFPEMFLTCVLAGILTLVAIELGQDRSKKELALEALTALQQGLTFVIALYVIQLF